MNNRAAKKLKRIVYFKYYGFSVIGKDKSTLKDRKFKAIYRAAKKNSLKRVVEVKSNPSKRQRRLLNKEVSNS